MQTRRDWQIFERKILSGKSIEDAAIEVGIPLEEAEERIRQRIRQEETTDLHMIREAREAEKTGLEVLSIIAKSGPRSKEDEDNADLQAAKSLLDYSLKARKLARETSRYGTLKAKDTKQDLFDLAEAKVDIKGPWDLTDPNA